MIESRRHKTLENTNVGESRGEKPLAAKMNSMKTTNTYVPETFEQCQQR